jgi:hypothetical protein
MCLLGFSRRPFYVRRDTSAKAVRLKGEGLKPGASNQRLTPSKRGERRLALVAVGTSFGTWQIQASRRGVDGLDARLG